MNALAQLAQQQCINLETFRKSGNGGCIPTWITFGLAALTLAAAFFFLPRPARKAAAS